MVLTFGYLYAFHGQNGLMGGGGWRGELINVIYIIISA